MALSPPATLCSMSSLIKTVLSATVHDTASEGRLMTWEFDGKDVLVRVWQALNMIRWWTQKEEGKAECCFPCCVC